MKTFLFLFLSLISIVSCNPAISNTPAANLFEIKSEFLSGPSKILFEKDSGIGNSQGYWKSFIVSKSVGKAFLDQFEIEGGDPELVAAFVDSLGSSRQKILFLIVKWRQVHRQEKVNGIQYLVRAFSNTVVSEKNGFRKLALHDSLSKKFGGGFQGEFQGRESFFQFKNQASIQNELMGTRLPEAPSPCFHTYVHSKGKSREAQICLDSLVNENRIARYSMDDKTIAQLNDAGYFLNESGNFLVALQILKKVVESAPKRTVAYLNLADVLWNVNQLEEAKAAYQQYFQMMSAANKGTKIPARVAERINNSIANGAWAKDGVHGSWLTLHTGDWWLYQGKQEGKWIPDSETKDSILAIESKASGYDIKIARLSINSKKERIWKIDSNQNVLQKVGKSDRWSFHSNLSPKIGMEVPSHLFAFPTECGEFPADSCLVFQEYDPSDSGETAMLNWSGIFIAKGIGVIGRSTSEAGDYLREYCIGGKITKITGN